MYLKSCGSLVHSSHCRANISCVVRGPETPVYSECLGSHDEVYRPVWSGASPHWSSLAPLHWAGVETGVESLRKKKQQGKPLLDNNAAVSLGWTWCSSYQTHQLWDSSISNKNAFSVMGKPCIFTSLARITIVGTENDWISYNSHAFLTFSDILIVWFVPRVTKYSHRENRDKKKKRQRQRLWRK